MHLTRRQFIGMLGSAAAAAFLAPVARAESDTLTFAVINDLHILDEASTAIVEQAVEQINAVSEAEFTVVLGDMGSWGTAEEMTLAKQALDKLERPYFCIPGNNDVFMKSDNEYVHYEEAFDTRHWSETPAERDWVFMGIDTCDGVASNVSMPKKRMDWIAKQLKKIGPEQPIALFAHHPFNPNSKAYRVKNADEVLALFENHNLRLVASGHYHGNQIETAGNTLFTTTACCSTTRPNFDGTKAKGFRIYELGANRIEHRFETVSGP